MELRSIIKEQREELVEIEQKEHIIPREALTTAKKSLVHPNILAILGIRRCGKSLFSYLLVKGNSFGYINFDDERLAGITSDDLNNVLEAFYSLYGDIEYIILDEIQNVPHWELFVTRLRRTKKVIITGSNSTLLSGELATYLTGRHLDTTLFPFSFKEFLQFKEYQEHTIYTTKEKAAVMNHLQEYLTVGGFPEVHKFGHSILARIYDDILTKDIIIHYNITKKEALKKLAKYLTTNASGEITYSMLARILNIKHVSTISNWVSYLENAFLFFTLERFSFKLKQQFIAPRKVYCVDQGIINSIGFKFSEDKGKAIENLVAVALQRRKIQEGFEVFYWKDHLQHEVDVVIKKGRKIEQLIQVSYINKKEDIRARESRSLINAGKSLRCKNLLVITWDYEAEENTIHFIPLWKWLL